MKNVGVNLFSLRTLIKDEAGLTATLAALGEMGYTCAQFSGASFDAEVIRRATLSSGVPVVVTHVPLVDILDRPEWLMREHEKFGARYIGLGTLPRDIITDEGKVKATIADLGKVAELMKKNGFTLFFHNHHTDCYKHGGKTILDYMIETCPDLSFILDTYWLQYGGLSVADYIKRLKGRIACVHLKDYKMTAREKSDGGFEFSPVYAPVGEGNLDFASYYPLMKEAGVEYYLVEQDNAVSFHDPLDEVRRSIDYIRRNFTNG